LHLGLSFNLAGGVYPPPPISGNKSYDFNRIRRGFRCKRLIRLKLLPDTSQQRSYGRYWRDCEAYGSAPYSPCLPLLISMRHCWVILCKILTEIPLSPRSLCFRNKKEPPRSVLSQVPKGKAPGAPIVCGETHFAFPAPGTRLGGVREPQQD
jgi:hypothetical protein